MEGKETLQEAVTAPDPEFEPEEVVVDPDNITRIIQGIKSESDRKVIEAVVMERMFSGPLPPPEYLAQYKSILPDAPERIMIMAEKEQQHRHDVENTMVKEGMKQKKTGQILGFLLALLFGAASFVLGVKGQTALAGILGTTTVIGLAVVFVLNKKPSDNERKEKNAE